MTIDTLEICFRADMTELTGQLDDLTSRLSALEGERVLGALSTGGESTGGGLLGQLSQGFEAGKEIITGALNSLKELLGLGGAPVVGSGTATLDALRESLAPRSQQDSLLPEAVEGKEAVYKQEEPEINLTVPINVDGMQLGVAAIRGINAVTRASGRLMLDI